MPLLVLKDRIQIPQRSVLIWFSMLIFFSMISTIKNYNEEVSLQFFNLIFYLYIIILICNIFNKFYYVENYFKCYTISVFAVCVFTMFSYIIGYDLSQIFGFEASSTENGLFVMNGSERNPGAFAFHLILSLPFAFYFAKISKGKMRIFFAIALSVLILSLFITYSRGAIIGFLIALSVAAMVNSPEKSRKKQHIMMLVFFSIFASLIIMMYVALKSGVPSNLIVNKGISEEIRWFILLSSLHVIASNPFFGIGSGRFMVEFPGNDLIYSHPVTSAHNSIVNISVEFGLLATLCFIMMLVVLLSKIRKLIKINNISTMLYRSLWIGVCAMAIDGLFHDNYINSGYWTSIAFLMTFNAGTLFRYFHPTYKKL
jgi:O-antigen ligase